MMMEGIKDKVKGFKFWATYYDVAQELNAKEQGDYYRAIMDYMFSGVDREEELPRITRIAFKSVKGNLNRSKSNRRDSFGSESGLGRDEVGKESGANREIVENPENALTLTLTSTSTSKGDGARSGGGKSARQHRLSSGICPQCGGALFRSTQTGRMTCGACGEVAS